MIALDPVTLADWAVLFEWRNDPAVRAASHDTEPIPLDRHLRWLRDTVGQDGVRAYIARDPMVGLVGTGRLTRRAGVWVVSVAVDARRRGQGYGAAVVRALAAEAPDHATLRAEVFETNYASLRTFASAGFAVRKTRAAKDGRVVVELERAR